ncbi:MAG: tRNA (adenosine(37)-N6)-threonylcarbamoyltransferase complex dimerization subunit type 1 TsaB [Sphingomonas sp. 28-66-16]|nr:MAG: tRNA (adenosine(37)-N6)-threonylcarbamoyltransferase complex dimerization subunit type 1 TsaB [Sphingomonas sp. 28-66-16]
MRTLVIETATAACSVALIDDGTVVAARHQIVGRGHAEKLLPMIAALPGGGRADALLVDCGPGSFTGIRVGIAAARALALGWQTTLAGYSSLSLLALAHLRDNPALPGLAVIIEGGHGEVFMQVFDAQPFAAVHDPASLTPAAALAALGARRAIGSGVPRLALIDDGIDAGADGADALPRAADAVLLPPRFAALAPIPFYGRAPDAKPMTPA